MPRFETPLVPRHSIAGRALVAVVAIMTFLASLTMGAVILVGGAASAWESDVAREVTIQVIPAPGVDVEATVDEGGGGRARLSRHRQRAALQKAESTKLLEPWLGSGLRLDELPIPRLIVVKLSPGAKLDMAALRARLAEGRARRARSTTTAAGSTACAPWPAPRSAPASPCCC